MPDHYSEVSKELERLNGFPDEAQRLSPEVEKALGIKEYYQPMFDHIMSRGWRIDVEQVEKEWKELIELKGL